MQNKEARLPRPLFGPSYEALAAGAHQASVRGRAFLAPDHAEGYWLLMPRDLGERRYLNALRGDRDGSKARSLAADMGYATEPLLSREA